MKTKIHYIRIFGYAFLFGVTMALYDFLHSHFIFMIAVIMAAAPVVSISFALFLRSCLTIQVLAPEAVVERNRLSYVTLVLKNPSVLMSMDVKIHFQVQNLFYDSQNTNVISLPTRMRGESTLMLPIKCTMNGAVRYTVDSIRVLDLLGFVELRKKAEAVAEVNVLPEIRNEEAGRLSDLSGGMTETEESNKQGHDFSDVSDVREYIPGDKLMSIHWKLSAKRDILMVKDRVSMSDQQMVILAELAGMPEEVDDTISLAYGLCHNLIQEKIYIRFLWWSEARYQFVESQLLSTEDLQDAYMRMYYEKLYLDADKTLGYMRSIKPELTAYVHVCQKEGKADAVIVEQG